MVTDKNFYTVCGWMRSRLHLAGNELIVYALIYSFSQDGESGFHGSLSYLQEFTGLSKRTIQNILGHLVNVGYLSQEKLTLKKSNYIALSPDEIFFDESGKNCTTHVQNLHFDSAKIASKRAKIALKINNNINNNIYRQDERKKERNNINHDPINARAREEKDYSKMTDEELLAAGEHGSVDWEDEESVNDFNRYREECKSREHSFRWEGKIVKGHGVFERLKSHEEILEEMNVKGPLRETYLRFLRECYLHGHLVSNEKLIDIICRLDDRYGCAPGTDQKKIKVLDTAINGGYVDIRVPNFFDDFSLDDLSSEE